MEATPRTKASKGSEVELEVKTGERNSGVVNEVGENVEAPELHAVRHRMTKTLCRPPSPLCGRPMPEMTRLRGPGRRDDVRR